MIDWLENWPFPAGLLQLISDPLSIWFLYAARVHLRRSEAMALRDLCRVIRINLGLILYSIVCLGIDVAAAALRPPRDPDVIIGAGMHMSSAIFMPVTVGVAILLAVVARMLIRRKDSAEVGRCIMAALIINIGFWAWLIFVLVLQIIDLP